MKVSIPTELVSKHEPDAQKGSVLQFERNGSDLLFYGKKVESGLPDVMQRPAYYGIITNVDPLKTEVSVARYADLHRHSDYSLLDGICKVSDMVKLSVPQGALTDHGVMYGFLDYYKSMRSAGKQPIIGFEAYTENMDGELSKDHLILLAKNLTGYKNLLKLCSDAFENMKGGRPHIRLKDLQKYSEGVICTSACIASTMAKLIRKGEMEKAEYILVNFYLKTFGDDFYLEIQRHGIPDETVVEQVYRKWAEKYGVKIVATTDSHYARKEEKTAHEVALCMQTGKTLMEPHMQFSGSGYHIHSSEEMEDLFSDLPEVLENTLELADKCAVELKLGDVNLPDYSIPAPYKSPEEFFMHLCEEGFEKRFGGKPEHDDPKYRERYDYEMSMIKQMGFVSYFIIVWDFINYARSHGIYVGPGRGSAAGSLLAYCIGITDLDPIKLNLIFERFLNPERVSWPDVDTDIEHSRRGEVIEYIKEKYGADNVCRIITFGSMSARMVIKDVGRVLGYPASYTASLAKLVPAEPEMTIHKAMEKNPDLKSTYESNEDAKKVIDMAITLEGCKRHASQHACFDAETMITTSTGLKKITDVKVGDLVLTHKGRFQKVVDFIMTETDVVYTVHCDGRSFCVTGNHPMMARTNKGAPGWKPVRDLSRRHQLLKMAPDGSSHWVPIQKIETHVEQKTMYNLTVLDDSSYVANGFVAHNCGLVIAPSVVSDYLPTAMVKDDETGDVAITSQVVMTEVEELSLLKMDLLGLKNLGVMHEAIDAIYKNHGVKMDYHDIPLNDRRTLQFLADGHTGGVFQLESPGMTKVVTQMLSDIKQLPDGELGQGFERMIAAVALYRPGPMDYIPDYLDGMHDRDQIHYDCPEEAGILAPTYGVMVYQEQLMQIAQKLAGYTLGRADLLRKACGKKKKKLMDAEHSVFVFGNKKDYEAGKDNIYIPGCVGNGITAETAEAIWEKMVKFASYAFNRSHAACYAYIAMITAWLSCYYPHEFYAAMLNVFVNDGDKFKDYLAQVSHRGIKVLPPDINASQDKFVAVKDGDTFAIRFGLKGLKGMNKAATTIVSEREKNGSFQSFQDLYDRMSHSGAPIEKKSFESLLFSGALDVFGSTRNSLMKAFPSFVQNAKSEKKRMEGQISIFDQDEYKGFQIIPILQIPEMEDRFLMDMENKILGIYLSHHPTEKFEQYFSGTKDFFTVDQIASLENYTAVRCVGMLCKIRKFFTKKEEEMYVFQLENKFADTKCVLFPKNVPGNQDALQDGKVVKIVGRISYSEEYGNQIIVERIIREDHIISGSQRLTVWIDDKSQQDAVLGWAKANPGNTELCLFAKGKEWHMKRKVNISLTGIDYLTNHFKRVNVS